MNYDLPRGFIDRIDYAKIPCCSHLIEICQIASVGFAVLIRRNHQLLEALFDNLLAFPIPNRLKIFQNFLAIDDAKELLRH